MSVFPQISIIIPIHNAEKYLSECLESVLHQTLQEIEVIAIDDASSDSSAEILSSFHKQDARLKIITYPVNRSASQARKDGVLMAEGTYMMFLDADDTLELNACENLLKKIQKYHVDILQFGTFVDALPSVPHDTLRFFKKFVKPYVKHLTGKKVFEACFQEKHFRFNLWNKIYKTSLCKKAFAQVEDGFFPKAQDLYAFFILSWYASSYYAVNTKYYHYHYGRGITGENQVLSLEQFQRICSQSLVVQKCQEFLQAQNVLEKYSSIIQTLVQDLRAETLAQWMNHLPFALGGKGFDLLAESWGLSEVQQELHSMYPDYAGYIAGKCTGAESLPSAASIPAADVLKQVHPEDAVIPEGFEQVIPVVFCANNSYALYAGVAAASILKNAGPKNYYRIYFLYNRLSESHIHALESFRSPQASIQCINVEDFLRRHSSVLYERDHFTQEMYYRFFIADLFYFYPRIIYLDCDLVVLTDLSPLLKLPMENCAVAAVKNMLSLPEKAHIKEYFLLDADTYINSGVLVINGELWRKYHLMEKCFALLENLKRETLFYPDQDILNIVCEHKIYPLNHAWNFYWHMLYGEKDFVKLCEPIVQAVGEDFKILHFASGLKPWKQNDLPLSGYFWKYAEDSLFYEEILSPQPASNEPAASPISSIPVESQALWNEIQNLNQKIMDLEKENLDLKSSFSYKTGRFLTWLPRKIRSAIRAWREHGFTYTLHLFFFRLGKIGNRLTQIFQKVPGGIRCFQEHGFKYTIKKILIHFHLRKNSPLD